jgi:phosphohistidine phosphatase SixA
MSHATGDRRRRWIVAPFLSAVLVALAGTAAADEAAWAALEKPGRIALMRHALAPGTGDPANFALGDCSTQRNLNAAGRAQARAVGAAFRERGIAVDRVRTSQWCRCRDTAELLDLGPVAAFPALNSFYRNRATAEAQTRKTREFLASVPEDERVVLVTHQVNITALTDRFPAAGEVLVIDVDDAGTVKTLGSIQIRP